MKRCLTFLTCLLPLALAASTGWWFLFSPGRINKEVWVDKDEVFCGAVFSPFDTTDTLGRPDQRWPGYWAAMINCSTYFRNCHISGNFYLDDSLAHDNIAIFAKSRQRHDNHPAFGTAGWAVCDPGNTNSAYGAWGFAEQNGSGNGYGGWFQGGGSGTGPRWGVYCESGSLGIYAKTTSANSKWAGYFEGQVNITDSAFSAWWAGKGDSTVYADTASYADSCGTSSMPNDSFTLFLRHNGIVPLTADWAVGGIDISGVEKLTLDTLHGTDTSGADSFWVFDDGDTTRFFSDNPIKIGDQSLIVNNATVTAKGLTIVDSLDIVKAGVRTWNFRYTAHDSLGAIPTLHIDTDKNPGLGFYINEDDKLAIWDVAHLLPDNPAGSGKFALSVWGDIVVGDIYTIEVNPIAIGKRITPLTTAVTTSYYSNRNINNDTNGGAGITLAADQTGAVASGYINLVAWGRGTDSLANSIMFSNRNAGTLQRRMMLDKDGNLALGIHDPESTIDVYKNTSPQIALRRTATTGWANIKFLDGKDNTTRWEMGKAASNDAEGNAFYLFWGGAAGRVMTIDTSGIIKAEHEFEGVGAERYVDRGDPAGWDFTQDSSQIIEDATWRDLDLSGIVPAAGANHLVHIYIQLSDDVPGQVFAVRENGNTNGYNAVWATTQVANITIPTDTWVMMDGNRKIEYYATNAVWTNIYILVRGWYQDE